MTSPTARTLALCRKRGSIACVVEKWNPHARIRQDAFGWIDILELPAAGSQYQLVGIQATSDSNVSARVRKIQDLPQFWRWKEAGLGALVIGWKLSGPRGKRKKWTPREVWL